MLTKNKILWPTVIASAFAIFSMFFGSGNLVYPINTGQITENHYLFGALGFILTEVFFTFSGLLGVVLCQGDTRIYFKELPYPLYFILITILLSMIGPFFVIPRCVHVAFGGITQLSGIPLWGFSIIFILSLFLMFYKSDHVVGTIGKYLSPFKFGGIFFTTIAILFTTPAIKTGAITPWESFLTGAELGCQTMDFVAAIFFSSAIYSYFKKFINDKTRKGRIQLFKNVILSCVIGLSLISLIYMGFIVMGASYAKILTKVPPENYFPFLTKYAFGDCALYVIAFTLLFSTLATALILSDVYIKYLHKEVFREKCPLILSMLITFGIAYALSLLGFSRISLFFGAILNYLYPALLVFSVYKLVVLHKETKHMGDHV